MCGDNACPSQTLCKRHPESGTIVSSWQSWMPYRHEEGKQACTSLYPKDDAAEKLLIARGAL